MSRKKQTWHVLCEGVGCDKATRCLRHVYYLLHMVQKGEAEVCIKNVCDLADKQKWYSTSKQYKAYISQRTTRYERSPDWWTWGR